MTIKERVEKMKYAFSGFFGTSKRSAANSAATSNITAEIASTVMDISKLNEMMDEDIYEQFIVWDTDAGGAVDKLGNLTGMAFKNTFIKDTDKTEDESEKNMLIDAEKIFTDANYRGLITASSELLLSQGNVFVMKNKDHTLTFLPNKYCTLVDESSMIGSYASNRIMMKEKILVVNEKAESELDQVILQEGKYYHIRYNDTPINMNDMMGRKTFNMYSLSPMHRAVLPVWWKRQMMIIDVLWRYQNVPRPHYTLKSENFMGSGTFTGTTIAEREQQRQTEFNTLMSSITDTIKKQDPSQGLVSSDLLDSKMLESRSQYTNPNDLMSQIKADIYTGLNIPPSVVDGSGSGSYASELVISNYVSSKVIYLAERIKPMILDNLRERLLTINRSYPVDKLDIKLELTIAESNLDVYRMCLLMKQSELYTPDEIREVSGHAPLTEEQQAILDEVYGKNYSANETDDQTATGMSKTASDITQGGGTTDNPDYPETPQSEQQHTRDPSENAINVKET